MDGVFTPSYPNAVRQGEAQGRVAASASRYPEAAAARAGAFDFAPLR